MPTYDYKCEACGHTFEKFQSIMAAPIRKCPKCGKNKVKRLLGTGGAMIFKGSGFYITDYRSEGYKNAAKADTGNSSSSSSETKPTESKPAASSEKSSSESKSTPSKSDSGSKSSKKK